MEVLTHSILPFVAILLALIVIHEAGHYFTAKLFGIRVLEAGVGFPPRVFGFTWRDTIYSINLLPLGAFVRLLGEEDPSHPDSLAARPKWQRTVVIASGAVMNLVLAIVLFSVALMVPRSVSEGGAVIADVIPGSPAQEAGLQPGDQIVRVNGRLAESTQDAAYFIRLGQGSNIDFEIKRTDPRTGTETLFIDDVYARWNPPTWEDECGVQQRQGPTGIQIGSRHGQFVPFTPDERAEIEREARKLLPEYRADMREDAPPRCYEGHSFGFVPLNANQCADLDAADAAQARALKQELFPDSEAECFRFDPGQAFEPFTKQRSQPIWEAIPNGTRLSFESLIVARNHIWSMIRGYTDRDLAGPVGIAHATGEVVEGVGWISLIEFAALLSMNLAILNILPIPMFDGGRLVFILIEFLRGGRRIAPEKEALVHLVGLVFIISLAVVITYFDIARIFRGDSLLQ